MFIPRYYQKKAFDRFFEYTAENHGKHPLIVLPTGSGKSYVQAMIIQKMLTWKKTRVLCITHQKELIAQNYAEYLELTEQQGLFSDVGIFSAGLNRRDTQNRVLFAGIQSVYNKAWELGWFDVILVDEAHSIPKSGNGMYLSFFKEMFNINKRVVIGGLTATAYRMKSGMLTDGKDKLFDDVCYEATVKELIDPNHYRNLDKKQYLCNIISKPAHVQADLSGVHIRGGEYVADEMQTAFMSDDMVCKAVNEIKELTHDRNKLLVFTAGIKHCHEVCDKLNAVGISAKFNHSKQGNKENDRILKEFRNGEFKALVNIKMYTTGFNQKDIDCVCILRATDSPGLYSQIVGRGLRMHPSKENTLVLDFGGNILRHGPIDKIEIITKKNGTQEVGTVPQKTCPNCEMLCNLSVRICPNCGFEFPEPEPNHDDKASTADILSKYVPPETIQVKEISYSRHEKKGKSDSLRVDYYIGMFDKYSEWVCIEHEGFAKRKAETWVKERLINNEIEINTVSDAIRYRKYFKVPNKIIVDKSEKFPKIIGYLDFFEPKITEKDIEDINSFNDYDDTEEEPKVVWDNVLQKFINIDDDIPF